MSDKIIKINKKGDDGHKVISVRMKEKTLEKIDELARVTNRSRNEIVNIILDSSIDNIQID